MIYSPTLNFKLKCSGIERIMDWLKKSDLVFDSKKTKTTLFLTFQASESITLGNPSIHAF